jgi:hypothetical protein
VNYDSEGDCKRPTDRDWTWLELGNRVTGESLAVYQEDDAWSIDGDETTMVRAQMFLRDRCGAICEVKNVDPSTWNHQAAMVRSAKVAAEFEQPVLAPFDMHLFWGSWKWIGWFSTDLTWVGRWIMHSLVRKDPRAIPLCVEWIRTTSFPEQAKALSYAIAQLSGEPDRSPAAWLRWYNGTWFKKGAKQRFPDPDFDSWLSEMKREFPDSNG